MTTDGGLPALTCTSLHSGLCDRLEPLLAQAAGALCLGTDFRSFALVVDDLPGLDEAPEPWLRLEQSGREGLLQGTLFCAETAFLHLGPASSTVLPGVEIWEQGPPPMMGAFESGRFSETGAAKFLHHQLLVARDWARGELVADAVSRNLAEPFAVSWAVVVDGRLAREGLPGYTMAERRGRFSRFFSSAGVLLPGHWEIFQSLWEGGILRWKDVRGVLRHLPGGSEA